MSGISVTYVDGYGQAPDRRGARRAKFPLTIWSKLAGLGEEVMAAAAPQAPPLPVLPGERNVLRDVEAGAGSCGVLKCWLWLPIGAGVGIGLGLLTLAVVSAVRKRRGG